MAVAQHVYPAALVMPALAQGARYQRRARCTPRGRRLFQDDLALVRNSRVQGLYNLTYGIADYDQISWKQQVQIDPYPNGTANTDQIPRNDEP